MPISENPALARDPFSASLRASRERRATALRRRRRRMRGKTGAVVAVLSLTVMAGGAVAAPPASSGDADTVQSATTADAVRALQTALGVSADGVYGPRTTAAVKRFQKRNGLVVDGVAGPATLVALGVATAAPATRSVPKAAAKAAPTAVEAASTTGAASATGADADTDDAPATRTSALLERIAQCESGGDPTMVSDDGMYRGKYQFARATWRAMGGKGDPAAAPEAEQDRRAELLLARQGRSAWPVCAA